MWGELNLIVGQGKDPTGPGMLGDVNKERWKAMHCSVALPFGQVSQAQFDQSLFY